MINWNQKIYEKTFSKLGIVLTPLVWKLKKSEIIENDIYIGNCCQNKFIIVDCRNVDFDSIVKSDFAIRNIEKFNVDSVLYIKKSKKCDAFMEIFEKDGSQSDSCGNGLLLISHILGIKNGKIETKSGFVDIQAEVDKRAVLMNYEISNLKYVGNNSFLVRVGEPHLVVILEKDIKHFDLKKLGEISQKKFKDGVNVDVIQKEVDCKYFIRTYERGVFDETKSCGTGSLSSYLAVCHFQSSNIGEIEFESNGGIHNVSYDGIKLKLEVKNKFIEFNKIKIN